MDEHALDPTDLEEFRIFVRGMTELSQVLGRLPSYSNKLQGEASLGAGCRYDFEQAAREILRDGVEFRSAAAKSLEVYRGETRTAIDKALRMVHDGMHEVGVERQEILRDARGYLSEVLDSPECMAEPLLWFYQGWLSWKRRLEPEAAQHAFFQACLGSSPRKDILCRLACRHLAYLQCASGAADAAYATVGQALRIQADHLTLLEFARYAASSGHKTEAVRALARCIELCPMATLDVFAEEEFAA
jgi:hypothetical protein